MFKRSVGRNIGIGLFSLGFALSPIASVVASEFNTEVEAQSEGQYWSTYDINLLNSDNVEVDLMDAVVQFVLDQSTSDVRWKSTALSYPTLAVKHAPGSSGVVHDVEIKFSEDDWVDHTLQPGESFTLTVAFGGQIADISAFEESVKVITQEDGTPSDVEVTILSPQSGAELPISEAVDISAQVTGEDAVKVEFWAQNERISEQQIEDDKEVYTHSWTPTAAGEAVITVIAFNEAGENIEQQSVDVEVTSSEVPVNPPIINFLSPADQSSHKLSDQLEVSAQVTDADDDLVSVTFYANNTEICTRLPDPEAPSDTYSCDYTADTLGTVEIHAQAVDAAELTTESSLTITVTDSSGGSCGAVPQYEDGIPYQVGDQVSNVGSIFSCKVFGWCGDPVWAPGTGHPDYPDAWEGAWDDLGECDVTPPPEVGILSPAAGERIAPGQAFVVTVDASSSESEIAKVDLLLGGEVVATSTEANEEGLYIITVPGQSEGPYVLTAVAYDLENGFTETTPVPLAVTDQDLVVSLTSPADGSTYTEGRTINLTAKVASFEGEIDYVEFYINNNKVHTATEAPYQYDWIGASVGGHSIYAKAVNSKDVEQKTAVSDIEVKVHVPGTGLADNPDRSISYLTSWAPLNDTINNSNGDGYLLAFGQWTQDGTIISSDGMFDIPAYDAHWLAPNYLSWTHLKHDDPEKAVLVAFGGQTYESIWGYLNTPESREAIAEGLIELLKTPYPVYKKGLTEDEIHNGQCLDSRGEPVEMEECNFEAYQIADYITLDGLDFDFEKTARITEQENENLEALIDLIRADEEVGHDTLLSLTTYHVGADPESCLSSSVTENCSYVEPSGRSAHHGEVIPLLQSASDKFDFFNVMAYDAGENFLYKVAMNNYAQYVDKDKVVLGNTINSQWGPEGRFVEERTTNIERTQWQHEEGYGGFFMWTLGASTLEGGGKMPLEEQVEYFNEMDDVNQ
ncbi:Ig-like domain-containing protein [Psychromonas ossibalaenae]|uniref:Ig-like domain-containing protein n=1 Tax=Psychromonas ossibalaenae TaxID=444922 RepID=UPI0003634553|nr:Ig-like domain-containing protein [Psychromonas ossibalaenae]